MRIVSWNINGLRAAMRKGLLQSLDGMEADIVCLQETRALREQVGLELAKLTRAGWFVHLFPAERKGYSGVAILSRIDPRWIDTRLDAPATSQGGHRFDCEGRFQLAAFPDGHGEELLIGNGYFPNGNGTPLGNGKRSNDRVPYKLAFYARVQELMRSHGAPSGEALALVMGDFNTAHTELDLARPKQNRQTSGFLDEEREVLEGWITSGWVDTFRRDHPGENGHYTWWAQRANCRPRNIGWRIDYILSSARAAERVSRSWIMAEVEGSDHCPLAVELD